MRFTFSKRNVQQWRTTEGVTSAKWKRVDERREHGVPVSNQEPVGHEIAGVRPSPTGGKGNVVGKTREERGGGIMGDPVRMKNGEVRGTGDRSPRTRPGGAVRLPEHLVIRIGIYTIININIRVCGS